MSDHPCILFGGCTVDVCHLAEMTEIVTLLENTLHLLHWCCSQSNYFTTLSFFSLVAAALLPKSGTEHHLALFAIL